METMNYSQLASPNSIEKTSQALTSKGYTVKHCKDKEDALSTLKSIIPDGATVMQGASVTLEEVGFMEYLKSGAHGWEDLQAKIHAEDDQAKRAALRRESVTSDFYLGSVHALCETGEFVIASNTGSQLPHVVYTSPNVVYVVSTKKIVPDLNEAMKRLEEYVIPLEDQHMKDLYNMGTTLNKVLITKGESPMTNRTITFILVDETLGF